MAGAGLAGNRPQSAFGASQEGGDASAKRRILSPHIFPFADLLPHMKILGRMGVNVLSPHTWTDVSKRGELRDAKTSVQGTGGGWRKWGMKGKKT